MTHAVANSRRRFLELGLAAASLEISVATRADAADTADNKPAAAAARPVYLVVYRPGPAWIAGQPLEAQPLKGHGRHMLDMYRKGLLRSAGRFADGSGGAAAFEADDDDHAAALIAMDPAVVSGVFVFDLRRWALVAWDKFK